MEQSSGIPPTFEIWPEWVIDPGRPSLPVIPRKSGERVVQDLDAIAEDNDELLDVTCDAINALMTWVERCERISQNDAGVALAATQLPGDALLHAKVVEQLQRCIIPDEHQQTYNEVLHVLQLLPARITLFLTLLNPDTDPYQGVEPDRDVLPGWLLLTESLWDPPRVVWPLLDERLALVDDTDVRTRVEETLAVYERWADSVGPKSNNDDITIRKEALQRMGSFVRFGTALEHDADPQHQSMRILREITFACRYLARVIEDHFRPRLNRNVMARPSWLHDAGSPMLPTLDMLKISESLGQAQGMIVDGVRLLAQYNNQATLFNNGRSSATRDLPSLRLRLERLADTFWEHSRTDPPHTRDVLRDLSAACAYCADAIACADLLDTEHDPYDELPMDESGWPRWIRAREARDHSWPAALDIQLVRDLLRALRDSSIDRLAIYNSFLSYHIFIEAHDRGFATRAGMASCRSEIAQLQALLSAAIPDSRGGNRRVLRELALDARCLAKQLVDHETPLRGFAAAPRPDQREDNWRMPNPQLD